jgi:pimeloyl-ACP methyl ester carboxylesterase
MTQQAKEETTTVAGTTLRYLAAGAGRPVLLLHGAAGASWSPLHDALSAHFRVIAPEHPGFGRSAIPDWMMGMSDLALFYLDVLRALDLRDVHLVGHCVGGWIAAEVAIRSTGRLATLALLAPAGVEAAEAPFDDIFLWSPEESARRQFHDQTLAEAWRAEQAKVDIDSLLQDRTGLARIAWNPRLHNPQLPYWLHRINVPTLLVWGDDDRIVPLACHKPFVSEIKGARLVTLPRTGHALTIEHAGDVAAQLNSFIQGAKG